MEEDEIYKLKIEVWKPSTIPMKRLAQYMLELSKLMGYETSVHFEALEESSAVLVEKVEHQDAPKVKDRLKLVQFDLHNSPKEASKAFNKINEYLRADNASANLYHGDFRDNILVFPGANEKEPEQIRSVDEYCTIRGTLLKIGGRDETVPLELQDTVSGQVFNCETTTKEMAKELAHRLFSEIELSGNATWEINTATHEWKLKKFVVLGFNEIQQLSIDETLKRIKEAANFNDTSKPYKTLKEIRENGEDHKH